MSAQHDQVAATLAELQAELDGLAALDAGEKKKLDDTLAALRSQLAASESATGGATDSEMKSGERVAATEQAANSVARRLGLAAGRLESSHPTFSTNLAALAGVLAQMGF